MNNMEAKISKRKLSYVSPQIKMLVLTYGKFMNGSGVTGNGMGYGGIDEDGSKDPSAKSNIWDDY